MRRTTPCPRWPRRPRPGPHATISMQALKGRASYLGPRSVGHEDPGRGLDGAHPRALSGTPRRPDDDRTPAATGASQYPRESASGRSTSATRAGAADRRPARQPAEDEVRVAFAAVARGPRHARRTAAFARPGRDEAGIVDIGALIAADSALVGPALDAVRGGADGIAAVQRGGRGPGRRCSPHCPTPTWRSAPAMSARSAAAVVDHLRGNSAPAPPGKLHPGPPRGRPGRPDPAGRGRAWPARCRSAAGPARTRRSSRAGSGCPCWPAPTPRVLAAAAGRPRYSTPTPGNSSSIRRGPSSTAAAARSAPRQARAPVRCRAGHHGRRRAGHAAVQRRLGRRDQAGPVRRAAGVGLLRTEIPFTGATGWPAQADHWLS